MRFVLVATLFTLSLGALAAPKFSTAIFQRPFTMPTNSFESTLTFDKGNVFQLGTVYGITDQTEIGLSWNGFETAGSMPAQSISLNLAQFLFSTHYVSSMAKFRMPFNFDRMVLQEITVGTPTYVPVIRGHLNLIFLEDIATLAWREETAAEFAFHAKLAWQATHSLYLSLKTTPGTLSTAGNHTHIANILPVSLTAIYAITPMVDVVASTGFKDIGHATTLTMMLGVAVRGGDIDG